MRVGRVVTCAGRGDEPGEIGRAMFENGVGTASFRGYKLVDEIVLELEVGGGAEDEDEAREVRRPGAGRVGMAGFDSAPGFASFSWMSDEAYEEYEESHEHEHDDEHEDEDEDGEASSDANEVVALGHEGHDEYCEEDGRNDVHRAEKNTTDIPRDDDDARD